MMFLGRSLSRAAVVLAFISVFEAKAQTNVESGWKAFLQNDYKTAKLKFTEASKKQAERSKALVALTLLAEHGAEKDSPFKYLKEFYATESNSAPVLFSLWFSPVFISDNNNEQDLNDFLKALSARKDMDGVMNAMAYSRIGKNFDEQNNYTEGEAAYKKVGAIENWQVTGEFENISGSGFDKRYDDIFKANPNSVYTNKYGAKLKWFLPPYARRDRWFDFTNHLEFKNSIVFAQTFVKSTSEKEIQLRAGVSGSIKVWLNDQLIVSESEERNNDLDTYIQTIKLHQGSNRILVQVGESSAGRSNFLIRLTDNNGHPIEGITSDANWQAYQPETSFKSEKVEIFAEKYLKDELTAKPEDPLNQVLLAKTYLQSEKVFEAQSILNKLKIKYPKSTLINSLLLTLYSRRDNRTGYESTLEAIKAADPGHPTSLNSFYREAITNNELVKAEDYLKKLEALDGADDPGILLKKIELAGKNNNQAELIKIAESGFAKYPDNASFVEYKYLIERSLRKNNDAAVAILTNYLKNHDHYKFSKALAGIYFDAGKLEDGLKIYQTEIDKDPVAVGQYKILADIYSQLQNYAMAEKQLRKALTIAPYESLFYSALAKQLFLQGKKTEAIAEYKNALNYNPIDYTSIEELRKLQNKKDVYSYFEEINVADLIKKAPATTAYPDDDILILNQSTQAVVYESGASEERNIMVAKILNQKGLQSWKEYQAPVDNWQNYIVENAEVIKANGTKVPAEVKENQIVFTNLEIGDCIYVKHRLFNYSKGQLANKFWDSFYFSLGVPYLKSSYSLLIANNQKLQYKFSKNNIEPKKSVVEDFVLYKWQSENNAGIEYEDKMPTFNDIANVLQLTTIPSWTFVSNWYDNLASAKAKPDFEVKELAKSLFEGKSNLTETQKAEIIYNYITQNISYSSVPFRQSGLIPQNPSTVINTRIGDCKDVSTLFLSLAKEVGLDAKLVLVNTKDQGVGQMMLPAIDFNHCIIKVNTEGKERYLELTYGYLPFNSLGNHSIGSATLDIDGTNEPKSIKYLDPALRNKNLVIRNTDIVVNNSDLLIKEKNYRVAAPAAYLRETYSTLSESERFKNMQEALHSGLASATLQKLSFKNLENSGKRDTLFMDIEYLIKDDIKNIAGLNILTLPWTDKLSTSDFVVSGSRKFPLDLSQLIGMDYTSEVMHIKVPDNKNVIESISPATFSNEFIDYELTVKEEGKTLSISRALKLKQTLVPANKVQEFYETYAKIAALDNKQLALK